MNETLDIDREFVIRCNDKSSDINEHLPTLKQYAEQCGHVTEFGVRSGNSTVAFMAARPDHFVSYDIHCNHRFIACLERLARDNEIQWEFKLESSLSAIIEPTDMLFIDTSHRASHCEQELKLHADNVRSFLGFHDTTGNWEWGEGEGHPGLRYAIEPFMAEHPEWKQVYRAENNNGLLILERQ